MAQDDERLTDALAKNATQVTDVLKDGLNAAVLGFLVGVVISAGRKIYASRRTEERK